MAPSILVVSAFSGQGGTGRWLKLALPELAEHVRLRCILKYGANEMRMQCRKHAPNITFLEVALQSPSRLFGAIELLREIRLHKPDTILVHHAFSMIGLTLLRLLGFLRTIPFVVVIHSAADEFTHVSWWKRKLVEGLTALALNRGDVLVAVAHHVVNYIHGTALRRSRIALIHNGCSPVTHLSRPAPLESHLLRVGFVGRFSIEKGADRLAGLVERLASVPIEWHIAGAGALDASLRENLRAHLESGKVRHHGWVADPVTLICTLDVLIVLSRTEGCPFAVLEAHSCGTLVVSLPVGGMPEALDYGAAGVLAQDLDAMANTLQALAKQERSSYNHLLMRAAELMQERYSLDGMIRKYVALIDETTHRYKQSRA